MARSDWQPVFPVPPSAGTPDFEAISQFACLDHHEIRDPSARLLGYVAVFEAKRYDDALVPVQYGINGAGPGWQARPWTDEGAFIEEATRYISRMRAPPERSLADIVETDFPEPKWAIPTLVPDGVTILAGPKSRGKSWIVFDFAIAMAGGYEALGNIECKAGPVLYLALEDTERRAKQRALAILQGKPPPRNCIIKTEWPNMDDGGIELIERWISDRPDARAVIVDVLARMKGRPDRAKGIYDQDYEVITAFKRVALATKTPIILVHHTNKAGNADDPVLAVSGTMGLTGAADTVLVLQREANDPNGMLYVRGRDVPEGEIALEFNKETGTVIQLGAADDFRKSKERREVLRLLADTKEGMTPAEVAQIVKKNAGTVRWLIHKMHKDGQVQKLANGRYTAW